MTRTLFYKSKPHLRAAASIAGKKEGAGPLGGCFDIVLDDDLLGQNSFEQAECEMQRRAEELCLKKAGMTRGALEILIAGDLLNQITASSFAARALAAPFLGIYGACSTMAQGILIAGALLDGGYRQNALCAASSHFCTAERQYRFPLELGNQRPPSAQWTATAAGAILLDCGEKPGLARLNCATLGKVVDYQVKDANHMGAAMAPAVADTLTAHFRDTGRNQSDYDRIVTGDLGVIGRKLVLVLMQERGLPIPEKKLEDCGEQLYSEAQDAHAGGSGCGCIASVLSGHYLPKMGKEIGRLLALGSGAMLSPTTTQQGESIPCISYAIALEAEA